MTCVRTPITTEDGATVFEGDRVYDYYSMKAGVIVDCSIIHAPDVWFDVLHDDGTKTVLNGQRICTMAFARSRGWPGA